MKRWTFVSLLVIATLLFGTFAVSAGASQQGGDKVRVYVQFAPGGKGNVEKSLNAAGADFHYTFDDQNTFVVTVPQQALNGLQNNPNVVMIEEDVLRFPIGTMSSDAATQAAAITAAGGQTVPYGVDMVQARDVWDVNRDGNVDAGAPTGAGRKVCIIDSGFYTSHEDLSGVNVTGYNGNLPWNVDGDGHGSHVAGTITAMNNALGVVGVTPGTVQIYVVRVFGDDGAWAYSSTLVDAANRCASAGANIISMSLGGSTSSNTEKNTFANLFNQGILSIAAAGNDGNTRLSYPASYPSVVSVAAIDSNGVVADFSQQNREVDIAAPGVGVLSTVPYIDASSLTVGASTFSGAHIEFSARGSASGELVFGGLCDSTGAWSGKVVLCERGTISFLDKVMNVQNSGGAAAVIYNNAPGGFSGTLGDGSSSTIVAISLSQEDGQALLGSVGQSATVSSSITQPASGYEYYDGTSMATPHVSAVAALVWSANPSATNAQVRDALYATAIDLGAAGIDNAYGNGLVQAKSAIDYLLANGGGGGGGGSTSMSVKDIDAVKGTTKSGWNVTFTVTVKDANGNPVSGAAVSATLNGSSSTSCTTGSNGQCSVKASAKNTVSSITYAVTNVTATGYTYNAAGNSDPDGDSNGTTMTVVK